MDTAGAGWSLITILGPILLAAVLIFAIVRNRRGGKRSREHTEGRHPRSVQGAGRRRQGAGRKGATLRPGGIAEAMPPRVRRRPIPRA